MQMEIMQMGLIVLRYISLPADNAWKYLNEFSSLYFLLSKNVIA